MRARFTWRQVAPRTWTLSARGDKVTTTDPDDVAYAQSMEPGVAVTVTPERLERVLVIA